MTVGSEQEEEQLTGGLNAAEVVRIGDTVHRPVSSNGEFIHDVLLHLEEVGFKAAPKFKGIDKEGREVLTYMRGEVRFDVKDEEWSEPQLKDAIGLLKDFHDATAGSEVAGNQEVVCHNDFAPWNVVFVDDMPAAIIDFDDAEPGSRLKDLSYAAWCWLGLGSEVHDAAKQSSRLRFLCDTYGVEDRTTILQEISERQKEIRLKHAQAHRSEQARGVEKDMVWLRVHAAKLSEGLQ